MQGSADNTAISRLIVTLVLVLGAVILAVQGVKSQNIIIMGMVFAIPLGIYFLMHPKSMLVWLFLSNAGMLLVPGMRGFTLAHILSLMIIGWWIVSSALTKQKLGRYEKSETFLVLFILNIILIMSVRGFSLGIFGGYDMGGAAYIKLLLALFLYFAAVRIAVEEKQIKWILYGSLLFSLLPFFAEIAVWKTGGTLYGIVGKFIGIGVRAGVQAMQVQDIGAVRWTGLTPLASAVFMLGLVLRFKKGGGKFVIPVIMVGSAILMRMATGFRGATFSMIMIALLWCIFISRNRFATAVMLIIVGVAGWLFLVVTIDFFPENMQRAVSFLPMVGVDQMVAQNAQNSIDFRLDIWQQCVPHIKEYLFVGRGLVVNVKDWAFLSASAYGTTEFFYKMHAYHSGPLVLLLDTGVPGLILASIFMLATAREGWKGLGDFQDRTSLAYRYYFFLNIQFSYSVFSFFAIYGDLQGSLPKIILTAILMRVLRYSVLKRQQVQDAEVVAY